MQARLFPARAERRRFVAAHRKRRLERIGEIARVLVAFALVALERPHEPGLELGGQIGAQPRGPRQGRAGDLGENHRDALIDAPHRLPREALVSDAAERPEIGAVIDLAALTFGLLGTHVGGRPEQRSLAGEPHRLRVTVVRRLVELGETEIEELRAEPLLFRARHEDVLGFEVAMDDVRLVRLREPARRLRDDGHRRFDVQAPKAREHVVQALAFEQLHHEERPFLVHARVVHVADVGAPHGGRGARFADEALANDA